MQPRHGVVEVVDLLLIILQFCIGFIQDLGSLFRLVHSSVDGLHHVIQLHVFLIELLVPRLECFVAFQILVMGVGFFLKVVQIRLQSVFLEFLVIEFISDFVHETLKFVLDLAQLSLLFLKCLESSDRLLGLRNFC